MAELTSGLTSVVFSPYSKMFIGGLSWQTSPGETVILFYSVSSISCCFVAVTECSVELLTVYVRMCTVQ